MSDKKREGINYRDFALGYCRSSLSSLCKAAASPSAVQDAVIRAGNQGETMGMKWGKQGQTGIHEDKLGSPEDNLEIVSRSHHHELQ